jgi:hypothetical protein
MGSLLRAARQRQSEQYYWAGRAGHAPASAHHVPCVRIGCRPGTDTCLPLGVLRHRLLFFASVGDLGRCRRLCRTWGISVRCVASRVQP